MIYVTTFVVTNKCKLTNLFKSSIYGSEVVIK
jgi:hypothetical protein